MRHTNSVTSMNNKRQLTAEEKTMAARIKAAIVKDPDLTEEIVGARIGVTQGQVSHWTGGRLPVPATRAVALAEILNIADPADISVKYRAIASKGVRDSAAQYDTSDDQIITEMRREIDALHALIAVMLTVSTIHRPVEVADVAKRLHRHIPKRLGTGFVDELLATLDKSLRQGTESGAPQPRSGSTSR